MYRKVYTVRAELFLLAIGWCVFIGYGHFARSYKKAPRKGESLAAHIFMAILGLALVVAMNAQLLHLERIATVGINLPFVVIALIVLVGIDSQHEQ